MHRNTKDLIGQQFWSFTVVSYSGSQIVGNKQRTISCWLCECACGFREVIKASSLKAGDKKKCDSCALLNVKNLTGKTFGTFTVHNRKENTSKVWKIGRSWNCVCSCGHATVFRESQLLLRNPICKKCEPLRYQRVPSPRGKLTPLVKSKTGYTLWQCECGNQIELVNGSNHKSCGCSKGSVLIPTFKDAAAKVFRQYKNTPLAEVSHSNSRKMNSFP